MSHFFSLWNLHTLSTLFVAGNIGDFYCAPTSVLAPFSAASFLSGPQLKNLQTWPLWLTCCRSCRVPFWKNKDSQRWMTTECLRWTLQDFAHHWAAKTLNPPTSDKESQTKRRWAPTLEAVASPRRWKHMCFLYGMLGALEMSILNMQRGPHN